MTVAEVSFDTVLAYARQLTPEEKARLIGELAQALVIPPLSAATTDTMISLKEIRERLRQSGYMPRTPEEVTAYIQAERDSWND